MTLALTPIDATVPVDAWIVLVALAAGSVVLRWASRLRPVLVPVPVRRHR